MISSTCACPRRWKATRPKLFGLTSDPERLSQVRTERRPGSKYASLAQCAYELRQAEQLYRRRKRTVRQLRQHVDSRRSPPR